MRRYCNWKTLLRLLLVAQNNPFFLWSWSLSWGQRRISDAAQIWLQVTMILDSDPSCDASTELMKSSFVDDDLVLEEISTEKSTPRLCKVRFNNRSLSPLSPLLWFATAASASAVFGWLAFFICVGQRGSCSKIPQRSLQGSSIVPNCMSSSVT